MSNVKISGFPVPFALPQVSVANGTEIVPVDQTVAGVKTTVGIPATALFSGGGSLTVTDGTHTETSVTEISFTSGATVSSGGAGIADVAVSGSGSSLFNITIDSHASVPTGVGLGPNDEFESGSSIDTAGTRYTSATAWTVANFSGGGTLVKNGALAISSGRAGTDNPSVVYQPIANPSAAWEFDSKDLSHYRSSGTNDSRGGMFLGFGSTGQGYLFGRYVVSGSGPANAYCNRETSYGAGVTNLFNNTNEGGDLLNSFVPQYMYLKISYDGVSTLTFNWSWDGILYSPGGTETIAAFLGTTTGLDIGLYADGPTSAASFDWFRRYV